MRFKSWRLRNSVSQCRQSQESHGELLPVPDQLLVLDRGRHEENERYASVMEAASWLSGERWSARPVSVHPVIASIAEAAADQLDDDERQALWMLVMASIGTGRRMAGPLLTWRLRRCRRHATEAFGSGQLRDVWEITLDEHARLTGRRPLAVNSDRLVAHGAPPPREHPSDPE